jgi:lipopolysaccharide export system protein LptA
MTRLSLCFIPLLVVAALAAEEPPATEAAPEITVEGAPAKEDLYNIEADVSEGVYKQGEQVLTLTGHVKVVHGTTTLTCDKAVAIEAQKLITAEGNVRVVDTKDNMTLTCGYGEYYREKKYVVAMKSPVLVSNKNDQRPITITADLMEAYLEPNLGIATGNVHVVSGETHATGATCTYYGKEDHIDLSGEPVAWERDSKLVGDKMTLILRDQKVEEALVSNNVRLLFYSEKKKKETSEEAKKRKLEEGKATKPPQENPIEDVIKPDVKLDQAEASTKPGQTKPSSAESEAPPVYNGRLEASGDLMHCYIRDDVLKVAFIEGSARGIYYPFDDFGKETGETLTVTGRRLTAYFAGGAVDSIVAEDNAVSLYLPAEGEEGKTITQGDIISMYIIDGKVDRMLVRGNANGSYYSQPITLGSSSGGEEKKSTTASSETGGRKETAQ